MVPLKAEILTVPLIIIMRIWELNDNLISQLKVIEEDFWILADY